MLSNDTNLIPRTEVEQAPAAQIQVKNLQVLFSESGFFVPQVSHARMSDVFTGRSTPETVVVGSGCVHTDGVSAGVPVDTVAFYAAAALVAKQSGLNKLVILIAPEIARANENISLCDPETREKLNAIEEWHTTVAECAAALCEAQGIKVRIVKDRDLMGTDTYKIAELQRAAAISGAEHAVCPYSKWQDLIFRTLQVEWGAGIKVGWTPYSDATLLQSNPEFFLPPNDETISFSRRLAFGEDRRVQGACEVAFDTNTRAVWSNDPIQACYIPAALTLEGKTVAPYTAKPIGSTNRHGRILLSANYCEGLQSKLHETALKQPAVLLGFVRQIATINQAFPSLAIAVPELENLELQYLFKKRALHKIMISSATEKDQKSGLSKLQRQVRFDDTNAEFAEKAAAAVSPRLAKLIMRFGLKG